MEFALILISAISAIFGFIVVFFAYQSRSTSQRLLTEAKQKIESIKKEIDTEKREALIKLKDELYKKRSEFDIELKKEKIELERFQSKINSKYEVIEKKELQLEDLRRELALKEKAVLKNADALRINELKIKNLYDELLSKLENLSGATKDQARQMLFETLENEVRLGNQKMIAKIEEETRQVCKEKSINILVNAMQRYTAEQVAQNSSGVIHLPNEEMKGRIIGKEGRNIKALEMATGMEFVIGEIPEIITISGFNPIRREVAIKSLQKLIADGRINPTRIEETVAQCEQEIEEIIQEYGKDAILQFNLQGVNREIVTLLGKLHFRTSFSQNVLVHSLEVALFARIIAEELGLPNPSIALRGGLLHDIGKAVSAEVEGPHAIVGADIAKHCGEDSLVVNAIAAHHEEVPFISVYSPIVMIADTISASRPGARRETLSAYIKRIEKLEEICSNFDGVKRSYALQAGREVRIIVEEEHMDDEKSALLAREIARKIEKDMVFPGQIKVNVIREKRAIEYAK